MLNEILFSIFILISLGGGLWAVVLTNRLKRNFKLNYLNTYLYYEILLLIFGLYGLIGMAIVKWIMQELETPATTVETIANIIPLFGIPFVITAWYMFIKLSVELVGKTVSSRLTISYFVFMLILILGYGYLIVHLFRKQSENAQVISDYASFVFVGVEIVTLFIAFYFLYFKGVKVRHQNFRRAIMKFAHINLIMSIVGITLFFFVEQSPVFAGAFIFIFIAGDIPAILFLGDYLEKYYLTTSGRTEVNSAYTDFISNYKISKREWEIVEKICEGLSNKQISEVLFISLQTVKDHTHRIYKKTGNKNRVQLVNMISNIKIKNQTIQN